jgi:lysozyme
MQTRSETNLIGLDISQFQGITDAATLFSKIPYLYLRAFGSQDNPDTKFIERVALCRDYNCPSGAYYFAHPSTAIETDGGAEAEAQANQFVDLLEQGYGSGNYGDLIPMVDIEPWGTVTPQYPMYYGITGPQLVAWIERFRDTFFARTNRRLGLYSSRGFLKSDPDRMYLTDEQLMPLADMPLWLAEWDEWYPENELPDNGPDNFGGWTSFALWQYSVIANADTYGLTHGTNEVDHDRTDSLDRIMPPPPPSYVNATQIDNNTLEVRFTRPGIMDYLGASVYVNGTWKAWVTNEADDVALIDISTEPRDTELTYQVVVEDNYSDIGQSEIQTLYVYDTIQESEMLGMPIASMGTTITKATGTAIAGLTSIGGLELSADTIDTTTLSSQGGYREFISSFKDAGEVSLSGFFEYTSHSTILTDFQAGTVGAYTITFPNGATWEFNGVVVGFTTGFELEDLVSFESTIKVSGSPTLNAPPTV